MHYNKPSSKLTYIYFSFHINHSPIKRIIRIMDEGVLLESVDMLFLLVYIARTFVELLKMLASK